MYHGVIYDTSHPPSDPKYRLSKESLCSLVAQLSGVPIRIEHTTHETTAGVKQLKDVGRVVSASMAGGKLIVDWEMDESPVGWSSERFIETGVAPELSLQHALYRDGTVKPIEVSIVRKGARDGCSISTERYKAGDQNSSIQPQLIMASAAETSVPPPAPTPALAEAAHAAPEAAALEQQPPAKRAKLYDTPMDFVNDITTKVTDSATLQNILDYFAENMDSHLKTQQEADALRQAKDILEQSQKAHVESSKNVVRDIVDTLGAMYQNFGAASMEAPHKEKLSTLLAENLEAREALRPILVAASGMARVAATAAQAVNNAAVTEAASKIAKLQAQLGAARGLVSSAPAVVEQAPQVISTPTPNWTQAAPVAEIAASGRGAEPKFIIPDILRSGPSFGESGGMGRVTQGMFNRKV